MKNMLIQGDNIKAMQWLADAHDLGGKVDLVYIDPPFATNSNFTITNGRASTVSNSRKGVVAYSDKMTGADFIEFLRARLLLLKILLSEKGSIYLHIDYKIGHHVKVLMDEVFGARSFRNDITRIKCNPKNFQRVGYGNIKDMILFYSKSEKPIWNEPYVPYTQDDIQKMFVKTKNGRKYTTVPIHAPGENGSGKSSLPFKGILPPEGRHWRVDVDTLERWDAQGLIEWSSTGNPRKIIYADEAKGKRVQDIWEYKDPPYPVYPTEKNPDLLELIINTSSAPNSIILDCFCGSGTTLKAAQKLGRNWIGIDQSAHAIKACTEKMDKVQPSVFAAKTEYRFVDMASRVVKRPTRATVQEKSCGRAA